MKIRIQVDTTAKTYAEDINDVRKVVITTETGTFHITTDKIHLKVLKIPDINETTHTNDITILPSATNKILIK